MPSSTSSSDAARAAAADPSVRAGEALVRAGMPGDDPRVVEGPVERPLPRARMGLAALIAAAVFVAGFAGWEAYWRAYGVEPGYSNSDGQWTIQRRRIDNGEGDALVLLGTSRMLFDVRLDVWEQLTGYRPIQLALEGTSPMFALEDLADDPDFTGRLIVDATPDLFFSGYAMRGDVLEHYRKETPSQRADERLAMLLEPHFAFLDPDYALFTVLERQAWPPRSGVGRYQAVRKLAIHQADRNTRLWHKVEQDPEYRAMARNIWSQIFVRPPPPSMDTPAEARALVAKQIERAATAVRRLRARGVEVVFIRPPSDGPFLAFENRAMPRVATWDVLLARTGAPGIHFEDHPDQQGLDLPEWSHLSAASAVRYTRALHRAWAALPRVPVGSAHSGVPQAGSPQPAGSATAGAR